MACNKELSKAGKPYPRTCGECGLGPCKRERPKPEGGFQLLVSFTDETLSFTNGFEAGMIWERLRAGATAEIEMTTHVENREVIMRMAVAEGWEAKYEPSGTTGWDYMKLTKVAPAPAPPNPYGLRVVK